MYVTAPTVPVNITYQGISNITTLHVSVNSIPARGMCGQTKQLVLVAIHIENAARLVNLTQMVASLAAAEKKSGKPFLLATNSVA